MEAKRGAGASVQQTGSAGLVFARKCGAIRRGHAALRRVDIMAQTSQKLLRGASPVGSLDGDWEEGGSTTLHAHTPSVRGAGGPLQRGEFARAAFDGHRAPLVGEGTKGQAFIAFARVVF